MTITVYTIRTEDHYRLGAPAVHTLAEPYGISRAWITRAEYGVPDGYTVAESADGTPAVYNAAGHHCSLADSQGISGGRGNPILVDNDANPWSIRLAKVCDLPW